MSRAVVTFDYLYPRMMSKRIMVPSLTRAVFSRWLSGIYPNGKWCSKFISFVMDWTSYIFQQVNSRSMKHTRSGPKRLPKHPDHQNLEDQRSNSSFDGIYQSLHVNTFRYNNHKSCIVIYHDFNVVAEGTKNQKSRMLVAWGL